MCISITGGYRNVWHQRLHIQINKMKLNRCLNANTTCDHSE